MLIFFMTFIYYTVFSMYIISPLVFVQYYLPYCMFFYKSLDYDHCENVLYQYEEREIDFKVCTRFCMLFENSFGVTAHVNFE